MASGYGIGQPALEARLDSAEILNTAYRQSQPRKLTLVFDVQTSLAWPHSAIKLVTA